MRKVLSILLVVIMLMSALVSCICGGQIQPTTSTQATEITTTSTQTTEATTTIIPPATSTTTINQDSPVKDHQHSWGEWILSGYLVDWVQHYVRICSLCNASEFTKETLAPGLYDSGNNMLVSWDNLVNIYGLDVERDYLMGDTSAEPTNINYIIKNNSDFQTASKLVIGDDVTRIGNWAFFACYWLVTLLLPNSIVDIGEYAISYNNNLIHISIPNSLISIGDFSFTCNEKLTHITIPTSVTHIGMNAFSNCTSLISIEIPDSVTSISRGVFSCCTSLTSIEIPDSVTSIGDYAFRDCSALTCIEISDSVTDIGINAFGNCSSLTSIVIPDSVISIGDWAFSNCTSLTIYCEAISKPSGWDYGWNQYDYYNSEKVPVVWGYTGE